MALRLADPGSRDDDHWEYAQYLADYYNGQGYDVQYPLDPTEIYYTDTYDRTVKQKAIFGELTFDLTEQVVGHRRRALVRIRARRAPSSGQTPFRFPDRRRRPRGRRQPGDLRERTRTRCSSSRRSIASTTSA